jgi:hypothetical protein
MTTTTRFGRPMVTKQISIRCANTEHSECDGRVRNGGRVVARCECECHQEGVLVGAATRPSTNPPMKETVDA